MNGQGSSGIGLRADLPETRARESEERAVEENAERFARALLPYVGPQRAPALGVLPAGWRPSAEVLTRRSAEGSGAVAPNATEADAAPAASDRVVINVTSADLGELSLILDRSPAGVRVVIGVGDAHSAQVMLPEREALLARLVSSGVRVASVQIVGQKELGTVLAPAGKDGGFPAAAPEEGVESRDPTASRRRGTRKLDLIG